MWIHKRKHSFPCSVLPWQEPAEDIYRTSPWSWTLTWPTCWGKKKKKGIPKWLAPGNLWTVVLWLKCRKGSDDWHRRNYVTRQSLALFKAHLFSASKMCQCHDIERGDLPLRKDMVRLGWWDMPQECCPTERKKHHHRLLCSSHSWSRAILPVRLSQLALPGSAVNPDVRDKAISLWSWQPRGRLLPQQVPSQEARCLKAEADWLQNWLLAY